MQLWSLIGHSWCLLMWGFLEFFKLGIFSTKNCLLLGKQFIFDIWWSSLDIMDDFKLISRTVFLRFGEINKSWFLVLSKKFFYNFFLVANYISKFIKKIKNQKNLYFAYWAWRFAYFKICLFHRNGKTPFWKWA